MKPKIVCEYYHSDGQGNISDKETVKGEVLLIQAIDSVDNNKLGVTVIATKAGDDTMVLPTANELFNLWCSFTSYFFQLGINRDILKEKMLFVIDNNASEVFRISSEEGEAK